MWDLSLDEMTVAGLVPMCVLQLYCVPCPCPCVRRLEAPVIWWPGLQPQSSPQWSWGLEPRLATASLQLQCGEGRPAGEAGGPTLPLHVWPECSGLWQACSGQEATSGGQGATCSGQRGTCSGQ